MQKLALRASVLRKLCFRVLIAYPLAGGIAGVLASAMLYWPLGDWDGLLLSLLQGIAFGVPAGLALGAGIVAPLWNAPILPSSIPLITGATVGARLGIWFQQDNVLVLLWFALLGFLIAFVIVCAILLVNAVRRGKRHEGAAAQG